VIIIIFGPPGAGKGTQSQFLVKEFNYLQISTGDLLRDEIKKKSELGGKISSLINKGYLVSDELIYLLLDNYLNKLNKKNKLIFDGYPRNLKQANEFSNLLDKYNLRINKVFFLNIDRELVKKRISGRVVCSKCNRVFNTEIANLEMINHTCGKDFLIKRKDDDYKTILKRFDLYMEETAPLIEYYKSKEGFCEIDGNKEIKQIYQQIKGFIDV